MENADSCNFLFLQHLKGNFKHFLNVYLVLVHLVWLFFYLVPNIGTPYRLDEAYTAGSISTHKCGKRGQL